MAMAYLGDFIRLEFDGTYLLQYCFYDDICFYVCVDRKAEYETIGAHKCTFCMFSVIYQIHAFGYAGMYLFWNANCLLGICIRIYERRKKRTIDRYVHPVLITDIDATIYVDFYATAYIDARFKKEMGGDRYQLHVPNFDNNMIWVTYDNNPATDQIVYTSYQILYGIPAGFGISCCYPEFILENFEALESKYICIPKGCEIDLLCQTYELEEITGGLNAVCYRLR